MIEPYKLHVTVAEAAETDGVTVEREREGGWKVLLRVKQEMTDGQMQK